MLWWQSGKWKTKMMAVFQGELHIVLAEEGNRIALFHNGKMSTCARSELDLAPEATEEVRFVVATEGNAGIGAMVEKYGPVATRALVGVLEERKS